MAEYTSGSLNSVTITAGDGDAYKSRYLTFSWKKTSSTTGTTTISWEIRGYGGNKTYSTFDIKLDGTSIYKVSDQVIAYNGEILKSGTKTYTHNASGAASVSVSITVSKIWNTISTNTKTSTWN